MHAELAADGVWVGRKRVARLMRDAGVQGVSRRKRHRTPRRDPAAPAPDLMAMDSEKHHRLLTTVLKLIKG